MADEADNPPFQRSEADVAMRKAWVLHAETGKYTLTGHPPRLTVSADQPLPSLTVTSIIIPEGKTPSGLLVKSTSAVWNSIAKELGNDWSLAYKIPPERWEEIVAGAFKNDGYDEVILTPRSRDHGRDVIAINVLPHLRMLP